MIRNFRETRYYAALAFLAQCGVCLVTAVFLLCSGKRKSSGLFAFLGAAGGLLGAYLYLQEKNAQEDDDNLGEEFDELLMNGDADLEEDLAMPEEN